MHLRRGGTVQLKQLTLAQLALAIQAPAAAEQVAGVLIATGHEATDRVAVEQLRQQQAFRRTRLFVIAAGGVSDAVPDCEVQDVEAVLPPLEEDSDWRSAIERAVGAFVALGNDPTNAYYFLDTKYNEVFDWFERTRWNWSDLPDFREIDRSKLTPDFIALVKHATLAEFGTLPGAHNFLREWGDEISFSHWALSWGAEENRHSLVLCRYLRALGVEVLSKHAMYKRKPYDEGPTRASTLMMNIISESRASENYARVGQLTEEPVARAIFSLLSRDEARHASAFARFCKELCDLSEANKVSAMEQAYYWLASQRAGGFKHPAGKFYPHTSTSEGFTSSEQFLGRESTDQADANVLRMLRKIVGDSSLNRPADIKRWLRDRIE
jgi:hypothetical protein